MKSRYSAKVDGYGDETPREICGNLPRHQPGIGSRHIDVRVGVFQEAVHRLLPCIDLLHLIQKQIVAPLVGHPCLYLPIHDLVRHPLIGLFRRIAEEDDVVLVDSAFQKVFREHLENGGFPAPADSREDLDQRNVAVSSQCFHVTGTNDHGFLLPDNEIEPDNQEKINVFIDYP